MRECSISGAELCRERAAALAGTYEAVNVADVWPGDVLALTSNGATARVMVRKVDVVDGMTCPETLTYRIAFANDWAEGLGLRLSETIAADALLPETALSGPEAALANLQQLQVTSITGSALQIDAGVVPPPVADLKCVDGTGTSDLLLGRI